MRSAHVAAAMVAFSLGTAVLGASLRDGDRTPAHTTTSEPARGPASAADIKPRSALPACGPAQMPSCAALTAGTLNAAKDPALGFGTQKDGGAIFNIANFSARNSSDKPDVKSALFQEQKQFAATNASDDDLKKRMKPLIDAAIDVIKNGNAQLSPEQQTLVDRLSSLTFKISENDIASSDAKNGITRDESLCVPQGYPNAGYKSQTHTMYVCPATMHSTAKQFIMALSHEIGHVVSPCMERNAVYKVDADQTFPGPIAECSADFYADGEGAKNDTVASLIAEKPSYFVGYPNKTHSELAACGVMKEQPNSSFENPRLFAKSMACLTKRYAANYKLEKTQTVYGQVRNGVDSAQASKTYDREKPPYCARIAEESFADSFAAKVMGKIAVQQQWSKSDFQIAVLDIQGFSCTESPTKTIQAIDEYPPYRDRVAVLLTDTAAEKALNCSAPPDELCPLEIRPEDEKPALVGTGSSASGKDPSAPRKHSTSTGSKK